MKVYVIWYRTKEDTEDRIRGGARNPVRAELMASTLDLHLRSQGITPVAVGVKSYLHGDVFVEDNYCMRWNVIPLDQNENNI